jgi:hypothetical protein
MIGDVYKLKNAMLGAHVGDIGYVFNEYEDFDGKGTGVQIIFRNGNYDGFSVTEQGLFLEFVKHDERYESYQFIGVLRTVKDYYNGYWEW